MAYRSENGCNRGQLHTRDFAQWDSRIIFYADVYLHRGCAATLWLHATIRNFACLFVIRRAAFFSTLFSWSIRPLSLSTLPFSRSLSLTIPQTAALEEFILGIASLSKTYTKRPKTLLDKRSCPLELLGRSIGLEVHQAKHTKLSDSLDSSL